MLDQLSDNKIFFEERTIDDLLAWVNVGKFTTHLDVVKQTDDSIRFYIYTDNYSYQISAHMLPDTGRSYLGCITSARKTRAGETWHRGNDLADGSLTLDTWLKILSDTLSNESVEVCACVHCDDEKEPPRMIPDSEEYVPQYGEEIE